MVLVGTVARPHGLRGQVVVNPETDFVETRYAVGARLWMLDAGVARALTVSSLRVQGGRPIVGFEGLDRLEAVEALAGRELRVPESMLQPLEPGIYYHHELLGCEVVTTSGERVGVVRRVAGGAGTGLLEVDAPRGEVLIPFAPAICVEVDVVGRRIRVAPPEGLLDLNTREEQGRAGAARDAVRRHHDLPADD
jgi:16S rRNA processing protein RimM